MNNCSKWDEKSDDNCLNKCKDWSSFFYMFFLRPKKCDGSKNSAKKVFKKMMISNKVITDNLRALGPPCHECPTHGYFMV